MLGLQTIGVYPLAAGRISKPNLIRNMPLLNSLAPALVFDTRV